ncbi:hypothetical protein HON01_06685 [Candidatus Woesearchaeota archaeon]|jgi:RNase P/RNase MRP subunit p30|nr:hypothetical protein [Candidatus Woesearchaeota archaeon]MBT7367872.1 hypothetical protein [Candidatus Woesearchaeota archaeon]
MIDFVFPKNNEQEFIKLAVRLGFKSLCFIYEKPTKIDEFQSTSNLKIYSGLLCTSKSVSKNKNKADFILMQAEEDSQNRFILENGSANILFDLELSKRGDFIHHRASGLNQVTSKLALEKDTVIGFSFNSILNLSGRKRAVLFGRISQNIRFARKFKFKTVFASFASEPMQMRSPTSLQAVLKTLGMTPGEAKSSLIVNDLLDK